MNINKFYLKYFIITDETTLSITETNELKGRVNYPRLLAPGVDSFVPHPHHNKCLKHIHKSTKQGVIEGLARVACKGVIKQGRRYTMF